jgi:hypothetical protein
MEPNVAASPEPQMPVQTIPQPASPKPKFSFKSKWPLVILAGIIVLSLPLGGFLLLGKLGIHPKPSTVTIKTAAPSPTTTKTPIPTPELVGKVIWDVQKSKSTPIELEIKNAFTSYNATPSTEFNDNRRLAVTILEASTVSASFAITDMELVDANNQVLPTDGFAYYLYKTNNVWNIMTGSENNFCDTIKTFPSDLLTENLKAYLVGCFPK